MILFSSTKWPSCAIISHLFGLKANFYCKILRELNRNLKQIRRESLFPFQQDLFYMSLWFICTCLNPNPKLDYVLTCHIKEDGMGCLGEGRQRMSQIICMTLEPLFKSRNLSLWAVRPLFCHGLYAIDLISYHLRTVADEYWTCRNTVFISVLGIDTTLSWLLYFSPVTMDVYNQTNRNTRQVLVKLLKGFREKSPTMGR